MVSWMDIGGSSSSSSSGGGGSSGKRSMWEKYSDPNRYSNKYAGMPESQMSAQKDALARKIQDALSAGTKAKKQAKYAGQYLALGGSQDEYDALIAAMGQGGGTGSPVDSDQNPYTGYGPQDVSTTVPSWMDKPTGKWDAYNQAMIAQWVQQQMQAENRKQGQALLGQGMDDIQSRLIDTPQIGAQDITNMRGAYESRLGMDQAAEMERLKADMARRGIQYDPTSGIGGTNTGLIGLRRQMAASQAGRDLDLYANQTNRAALERGIGAREAVRGNIANIGTGYGATPFTMMSPGEYQVTQNPQMLQPESPEWYDYLLQGLGAAVN